MKNTKQGAGIAVMAGLMAISLFWAAAQVASLGQSEKPLTVPIEKLPASGTFLSMGNYPPLPMNPFTELPLKWPQNLPVYQVAPTVFMIDDRTLDRKAMALAAKALQLDADMKAVEAGEMTLQSLLEGESGGTGMMSMMMPTNCGTGEPWTLVNPRATIQSNGLFTFECDIMGGFAGTNLHLFRVDSLGEGGITNFSNAFWQGAFAACSNVVLSNQPALGASFYFGVDEFTDAEGGTGDGLADWWELKHFGSILAYGSGDDPDQDGVSNYDEFVAGSDPNSVEFDVQFANFFVSGNYATGAVAVIAGVAFQAAVLVDSTNFAAANWFSYNSNLAIGLGGTDGRRDVWIGLKGRAVDSDEAWEKWRLTRDTQPPAIAITNPVSTNVSQGLLQLQGYSAEPLTSLTYNLTNAVGSLTNQEGFVVSQIFSTILSEFTTNYFQCFDLELTNGANTITVRATDRAGNTTTSNYVFTLAGITNPPVLNLTWPQSGAQLSGEKYTLKAWINDPSATVSVRVTGTNGVTNTVAGMVERAGKIWVENIPLSGGTNLLALTAADAWGNSVTTNIAVIKSALVLAMTPVPGNLLWRPTVNVSGIISDASYTVWVNGVKGTNHGNGTWDASNVPVTKGGTATFSIHAYAPGEPQP